MAPRCQLLGLAPTNPVWRFWALHRFFRWSMSLSFLVVPLASFWRWEVLSCEVILGLFLMSLFGRLFFYSAYKSINADGSRGVEMWGSVFDDIELKLSNETSPILMWGAAVLMFSQNRLLPIFYKGASKRTPRLTYERRYLLWLIASERPRWK